MPKSAPVAKVPGRAKPGQARGQKLYNTKQWRARRQTQWLKQPTCEDCGKLTNLKSTASDPLGMIADHIVPHQGNERLFDSDDNLTTRCRRCHGLKSRRERS